MKKIIFTLTFFLFIAYGYSQDRLILKNGEKIEGRFIRIIGQSVRFKAHKGRRATYPQKNIKELSYTEDGEDFLFKHRNIKGLPKDLFSHQLIKGQINIYLVTYRGSYKNIYHGRKDGKMTRTTYTSFETYINWYILEKGEENARPFDFDTDYKKIKNALYEIVKENNLGEKKFENDSKNIIKAYNEYYERYNSDKKLFKSKPKLTKEEKIQRRLKKIEERKKQKMKIREERERKRKERLKRRKDSTRVN